MKAKVGHYDVVAELGRGGMGVVYKGFEPALNRYVAIKMLAEALAHEPSVKERFIREARSMASLNDPHIIQIYYIGEDQEQPFFAMEFVEGESLSSYLKREGKLSPESAAKIIYQTAKGLQSAHEMGVVHRDIKPANLMLSLRGKIKIADFGIALSAVDFSKKLTSTGEFVGTPGYLSPEIATGKVVDARSDIFALGIVFFELLAGRTPFNDESPLGMLLQVAKAELPEVRELNSNVDEALSEILRKMTAKEPADRYQSCQELLAALDQHPAVRTGNDITARAKISDIAATVLGGSTLRPAGATLPSTPAPTPSKAGIEAATSARGPTLHRETRSNANHGLAVAAVVLLAVVAASAFAFRQHIPFLGGTQQSQLAQQTQAGLGVIQDSSANADGTENSDPEVAQDSDAPAPLGSSENLDSNNVSQTTQDSDLTAASNDNAASDEELDSSPTQSKSMDEVAEPLKRFAENRMAKRNDSAPVRNPAIALGPPRVAVVAIGDPAITGPAQQALEDELSARGFLLGDAQMVDGMSGLLQSNRPDIPRILRAIAQANNVRAVLVIRTEALGATQLNYYGQSDTLYSVSLNVRGYDVAGRQPLGAGLREKIDFTPLNADQKTREAMQPHLGALLHSVREYRPKGQRQ